MIELHKQTKTLNWTDISNYRTEKVKGNLSLSQNDTKLDSTLLIFFNLNRLNNFMKVASISHMLHYTHHPPTPPPPHTHTHTFTLLTCPSTKPSLRNIITEKMDKQQGMVTPNIIPSFLSVAADKRTIRHTHTTLHFTTRKLSNKVTNESSCTICYNAIIYT